MIYGYKNKVVIADFQKYARKCFSFKAQLAILQNVSII